jgi:hypothetical protein
MDALPPDYEIMGTIAGDADALPDMARCPQIDEIILAERGDLNGQLFQEIIDCYEQGIAIVPMPLLYEQITGRVPVEHVGQRYWTTMLPLEAATRLRTYPLVKRAMDVILSVVGLLMFALLLIAIAPLLWIDSPGPLFFRQARVGRSGRLFRMWKLRTMVPDAERDTGPQWAADAKHGWMKRHSLSTCCAAR